jgi:hypothetical protein
MKRLKGPELKMPELKVPQFLEDLFYDLRDRRLLPLVALAIVAIAAVPFLLGGGSKESPPPIAAAAAAPSEAETADSSTLTVVEAKPGLRDYRKRLARRKPTNPFKQRYTAPAVTSAELNPQTESSTSSSTTIATTTETGTGTTPESTDSGGASPGSTSPSPSSGGGKPHLILFTWGIDVKIAKSGGKNADSSEKPEPVVKHKVLPQTPLPGEKAPVVTYMGPARKGSKATGKALLLVSNNVRSVSGETRCVSGGDVSAGEVCQLLEVEPGFPVTFVYGANEVHYTINVLKIELVVTGRT